MPGPPRKFDEDKALEAALQVFWCQGYEGASMREILAAMGINSASFYNTYGDKRALFRRAIIRYGEQVSESFERLLNEPGSPLERLHEFLCHAAATAKDPRRRGCMNNNTAIELAPEDPEVAKAVRQTFERHEELLRQLFVRAIDEGELSRDADPRRLASFTLLLIQGFCIMAKAGRRQEVIDESVITLLSLLEAYRPVTRY